MGQPQTNKCSKCAKDYFVTDNQFFCDNCKPNKKETLSEKEIYLLQKLAGIKKPKL